MGDVHRYLVQRHDGIEWLRGLHARKNSQRSDAIKECVRVLEHDAAERINQIGRFTDEMKRHTNRKVDQLSKELADCEVIKGRAAEAGAADKRVLQFQIDRMAKELDNLRGGLCI